MRIAVQRDHMILMLGDPRYFDRSGFVAVIPMAIYGPHHGAGPAFQALVPLGDAAPSRAHVPRPAPSCERRGRSRFI